MEGGEVSGYYGNETQQQDNPHSPGFKKGITGPQRDQAWLACSIQGFKIQIKCTNAIVDIFTSQKTFQEAVNKQTKLIRGQKKNILSSENILKTFVWYFLL